MAGVPEDIQRVFVTAHEVPFEWHVRHQGAFQKSTDNGVSKTINLPNSATLDDVARAYLLAWELGCLGITVFRDGCKEGVLSIGTKTGRADKRGEAAAAPPPAVVKPRPRSLTGRTYRVETPLGTAYTVVNEHGDGEPFEVFVSVGKAGSDTMAVAEAMGRLISLALRMPSPLSTKRRLEEVVAQLSGIGGGRPLGFGPQRVLSLPDGIARVLAEHLGQTKVEEVEHPPGPPRSSWPGTSARSAGRRPSSTRKAARSATGAASTSAEPRSAEHPPAAATPPDRTRARGGRRLTTVRTRMNPNIPADYHETGAWLEGFVRSHAKRESPRVEALVETAGAREGRAYGVRLRLGERVTPRARVAPDRARLPRGRRGAPALRLVRRARRAGSGRGPRAPRHRPIRRLSGQGRPPAPRRRSELGTTWLIRRRGAP